jgi:hypothetical protein
MALTRAVELRASCVPLVIARFGDSLYGKVGGEQCHDARTLRRDINTANGDDSRRWLPWHPVAKRCLGFVAPDRSLRPLLAHYLRQSHRDEFSALQLIASYKKRLVIADLRKHSSRPGRSLCANIPLISRRAPAFLRITIQQY